MAEAERLPNPVQDDFVAMPIEPILLLAPPGCGKTEALAMRASGLVSSGDVPPPCRLLALTFSRKARDGLRKRVREELGRARADRKVTVHNFHGFSARIINAHGSLLGYSDDTVMPDRRWARSQLSTMTDVRSEIEESLQLIREIKQRHVDDSAVAAAVEASANPLVRELEVRRLAEHRLEFDDLVRTALQLLSVEGVRRLYRLHFSGVLVDEMQDMTLQQLELALTIGAGRTTLAGDNSQGIYTFAGAEPEAVVARFEREEPRIFILTESYRSAPRIITLVSAMARTLGGDGVSCAAPDEWSTEGEVRILRFPSLENEAREVLSMAQRLLAADPSLSVGVLARVHFRKRLIEEVADDLGLEFECWDRAVDSPSVRTILRRCVERVPATAGDEAFDLLEELCLAECPPEDVDLRDGLLQGMDVVRELCSSGVPLGTVVSSLAVRSDEVVSPGLHFLNAHVGKGQQFDWVVVLGMEDDFIPGYRAETEEELQEELRVLHVMCSRARLGLVFTVCRDIRWNPDREWLRDESRWLDRLIRFTTGSGDPTLD